MGVQVPPTAPMCSYAVFVFLGEIVLKNFPVKKAAFVLGICIIVVSAIAFLCSVISLISTFIDYAYTMQKFQIFNTLVSKLSQLACGVGIGGIVVLVGLIYDFVKAFSLKEQEQKERSKAE